MSDLFMDMHRRRRRWHNHQNTTTSSTSETTTTTTATSESPSSTQDVSDHTFSHHNDSATADNEDAAHNVNYKSTNRRKGKDDKHDDNDNEDDDAFANILSLKLRKPKHWTWELSTSKSCSNIALPRILLYDHKGQLLADACGDNEGIYREKDHTIAKSDKSKKSCYQSNHQQSQYLQRSATTNLSHSIRKALEKEFNSLNIQEATPSPEPFSPISSRYSRNAIDFNTVDLPDNGLSRQSSSLKGVRFNVENNEDQPIYESHIPEFLSTTPSTTTATSSSSGPREKRKYRRSQSSGRSSAHSESILERFSYQKGRFSSPEYPDEEELQQAPRYFLRTSKAGTLVVKEDSFWQHPRRRRRPLRHRSTDSLHSLRKTSLSELPPTQNQSVFRSPTPVDICRNKRRQQIRNKQISTSEEDEEVAGSKNTLIDNINSRRLRKYSQASNQTKDLNYSTDVHQNGKVR